MNFDDDFDMEPDFSDEENEELNKEMARRRLAVRKHPLFLQVHEVRRTLDALFEGMTVSEEQIESFSSSLTAALMTITAKVYAALNSEAYHVCIQNAAVIRNEAEYLKISSHMLTRLGYDNAYVSVFREEMEKFRMLFREWAAQIKTMDRDGFEDDWGLF